jgi:hypothetical protein
LDDVQPVRRAGEAALLGDRDEGGELPELHARESIAKRDNRKHRFALLAICPWVILGSATTHSDLRDGMAHTDTDFSLGSRAGRTTFGFWMVVLAFATVMAFTTVPTPLWSLYAQRDRFSSLTVTIVFAVYALAVALSLLLVGHVSDW